LISCIEISSMGFNCFSAKSEGPSKFSPGLLVYYYFSFLLFLFFFFFEFEVVVYAGTASGGS